MSWPAKYRGEACYDCGVRRGIVPWEAPWESGDGITYAKCADADACSARREKRYARSCQRSAVIVLRDPPSPSLDPGECRWCGRALRRRKDGQPARRERCDLQREGRDCAGEYRRSRTYDTRHAVSTHARYLNGQINCATCGVLVEGPDPMDGTDARGWDADHRIPLEDGGTHDLANLQALCTGCHSAKTARENSDRARRRFREQWATRKAVARAGRA